MSSLRVPYRKYGFTLFEVLITLLLVSIISGFAAVKFDHLWAKHELRMATRELVQKLQILRTKAILSQLPQQIEIQASYLLTRPKGSAWKTEHLHSGVNYFHSIVSEICQLKNHARDIRITYNGGGTSNGVTICLMKGKWYQKIILNSYGRIRTTAIES
jgi:prepilin-type N-terminal cleavage/methylation domain-containing protein